MRWTGGRRSDNVEDRRGGPPGGVVIGGGIGTLLLVVVVALLGGDPGVVLRLLQQAPPPGAGAPAPGQAGGPARPANPEEDKLADFVRVILADTEDVWTEQFRKMGLTYRDPKLVLFSDQVSSACGMASSAVGPFYCPADGQVYIDLAFYRELEDRFEAPGDFAQAYVLAHEVGHHVQNLLGISDKVREQQRGLGKTEANDLSVRLELQADFLAGVWAHHAQKARNLLESGDVEEGLRAASAIGDDRLMRQTQGYVVPDAFTHGSSRQRVKWFTLGLKTGDIDQGDTFSVAEP